MDDGEWEGSGSGVMLGFGCWKMAFDYSCGGHFSCFLLALNHSSMTNAHILLSGNSVWSSFGSLS